MQPIFAVFQQFFILGWISFGGPAAHLGYFHKTFVEKLHWLSDKEYVQLVALSQFLPGPGSSQVGFALGYHRAGLPGAIAAFAGFTLPSVILMLGLGLLSETGTQNPLFQGAFHGLKLLAVVVIADAIRGMAANACQCNLTAGLAIATAVVLLLMPGLENQMIMLIIAAISGYLWFKPQTSTTDTIKNTQATLNWIPLTFFMLLLVGLPLIRYLGAPLQLFADFFHAGSLVFGGGHVVLPLLQTSLADQLSDDSFLTGYAIAQAVPGPMFTLATYLGYQLLPSAPISGALLATVGIFLPGFLLLLAVLKNWQILAARPSVSAAIQGVNASVVGLLLAALYQPVFISAVGSATDIALILAGLFLLQRLKLPIVVLVVIFTLCGLGGLYL